LSDIKLYKNLCKNNWWETILLIDNYCSSFFSFCINWIWYLYVDMQLFIITPFIIWIYLYKKVLGIIIIFILGIISLYYQISIINKYNFSVRTNLLGT